MGTLNITTAQAVPAPLAEVWQYVVVGYFENHPRWDPAIVGMRSFTPGPVREGTEGEELRRVGPGRQRARFVVTALEPMREFAFRCTSGPFHLERRYSFSSEDGTTRLEFGFVMAPKGPMKLLFPLMRRSVERQVHANIARIPACCGRD